ncbi:hypothetical protein PsYK624_151730 [Phanerochaete sordida]|uniref:Uncharacterized protein n=1 Tax=Phanerochaete sordida TaxID=48140 RepID=A0A9P3LKW2_9APHY|nr:hypothetical protein PsYK624_151730 [Phanerochaete sordida]
MSSTYSTHQPRRSAEHAGLARTAAASHYAVPVWTAGSRGELGWTNASLQLGSEGHGLRWSPQVSIPGQTCRTRNGRTAVDVDALRPFAEAAKPNRRPGESSLRAACMAGAVVRAHRSGELFDGREEEERRPRTLRAARVLYTPPQRSRRRASVPGAGRAR